MCACRYAWICILNRWRGYLELYVLRMERMWCMKSVTSCMSTMNVLWYYLARSHCISCCLDETVRFRFTKSRQFERTGQFPPSTYSRGNRLLTLLLLLLLTRNLFGTKFLASNLFPLSATCLDLACFRSPLPLLALPRVFSRFLAFTRVWSLSIVIAVVRRKRNVPVKGITREWKIHRLACRSKGRRTSGTLDHALRDTVLA